MVVVHKFLTVGVNFINVLRTAFALVDLESIKNTVKSSVPFYIFGIYEHKSCMLIKLSIGQNGFWTFFDINNSIFSPLGQSVLHDDQLII